MHKKNVIFSVCFLFSLSMLNVSVVNADKHTFRDEVIVTDRPDFTEATETIDSNHYQLELGYTFFKNKDGGVNTTEQTVPEILTRIGLTDNTEARLVFIGYESSEVGEIRSEDVSDLGIGFKHRLFEQEGYLPSFSSIFELYVPTSNETKEIETVFKFLWSYDLGRYYLAGNHNFSSLEGEQERYLEYANSVTFGFGVTDKIGTYIEYFGLYPVDNVIEPAESFVNGGFTYLVNNDLQLDVRTGFGLNSAAIDNFVGFGLSFRR